MSGTQAVLGQQSGLLALVEQAGAAIRGVVDQHVRAKADGSSITDADLAAHRILTSGLGGITPDIPILSEESEDLPWEQRRTWNLHWLVDPLDGTKEFLAGSDEYTVNVALIEQGRPIFGIVGTPAQERLWWGGPVTGAWTRDRSGTSRLSVGGSAGGVCRVVASRRHRGPEMQGYLERLGPHEVVDVGSSLKFCMLAEGRADLYPRLAPTMEWDTAAGHAILLGAGGGLRLCDGGELRYGRQNLLNPHFIAFGSPRFDPGIGST